MSARPKVYIASKSNRGSQWVDVRHVWADQVEIVSTWIDESGPGESSDLAGLWTRCIAEASTADALLAVHFHGEEWKGAFVEIGAALAHGVPVHLVGWPPGSWVNHRLVTRHAHWPAALLAIIEAGAVQESTPAEPPDVCAFPKNGRTGHSWEFDGDDPRIVCHYCGEVRDAISGQVLRAASPREERP